jgi:hypothetical protein
VLLFFYPGQARESKATHATVNRISVAFFSKAGAKGQNAETPMNLTHENQANGPTRENFTHNA